MKPQPLLGKKSPRIVFVTVFLAAEVLAVLLFAIKNWTIAEAPAVLITALTIAVLDFFPIYLDPAGDLRLTSVITIPALVLFGWPSAMLGAAIGMIAGLFHQSPRDALVRGTERLASLVAAAAFATASWTLGWHDDVVAVVSAALGYTIIRTLVITARMHTQEAIAGTRAFRFLATSTFFHLGALPRSRSSPYGWSTTTHRQPAGCWGPCSRQA